MKLVSSFQLEQYGLITLILTACGVAAYIFLRILLAALRTRESFLIEAKERMEVGKRVSPSLAEKLEPMLETVGDRLFQTRQALNFVAILLPFAAFAFGLAAFALLVNRYVYKPLTQMPLGFATTRPYLAIDLGDGRFACGGSDIEIGSQIRKGDGVLFQLSVVRFRKAPRNDGRIGIRCDPEGAFSVVPSFLRIADQDRWSRPNAQGRPRRGEGSPCSARNDFGLSYSLDAPGFAYSKTPVVRDDSISGACVRTHLWNAVAKEGGAQNVFVQVTIDHKGRARTYRNIAIEADVNAPTSLDALTPLIVALLSLVGAILTAVLGGLLGKKKAE